MIYTFSHTIEELKPYIHWLYFFHAWQFPSSYATLTEVHPCPACRTAWTDAHDSSEHKRIMEAFNLYDDALSLLSEMGSKVSIHGRFGLFEANASDEDIHVFPSADTSSIRFPMLRQQHPATSGCANLCLSDFIRPKDMDRDHIGLFGTSVDHPFNTSSNPYRQMLSQTLCDRLAEAEAELLHREVRTHLWGYAPDERLSIRQLQACQYQGIRPAVGYPSLPDQSIAFLIDELIHLDEIGIQFTESGSMSPHGSICGLMFAHPKATYFSIGKITHEQLKSYAQRRGFSLDRMKKFLTSNL